MPEPAPPGKQRKEKSNKAQIGRHPIKIMVVGAGREVAMT